MRYLSALAFEYFSTYLASKDEVFVLPMLIGRTDASFRNTLLRAIDNAGVEKWPRLWHNLPATRQTELEKCFPTHVVCYWLGNSESTARKHYLQVTDDDYSKSLQKAVQQRFAGGSIVPQSTLDQSMQTEPVQRFAKECESVHKCTVVREGLEPTPKTSEEMTISELGGAECGAVCAQFGSIDPDLANLIRCWADLPEAVRAGILAMVRVATGIH